jgi:hypothetical protein
VVLGEGEGRRGRECRRRKGKQAAGGRRRVQCPVKNERER